MGIYIEFKNKKIMWVENYDEDNNRLTLTGNPVGGKIYFGKEVFRIAKLINKFKIKTIPGFKKLNIFEW